MPEGVAQPWWTTFFDDDYLATYGPIKPDDTSRSEALGAVRLAGAEPGAAILDAPCGFGRHAVVLAWEGYRVDGIDLSEVQLAEARRRAGEGEWPRFRQGDFRELPYEDGSFDVVLNLFTSLGYAGDAEDRRAVREFRRVLRPGGRLVIQTMHRDRLARLLRERTWDDLPDGGRVLQHRRFDPVTGTVDEVHHYLRPDGTSSSRSFHTRTYTATEIAAFLAGAGFSTVSWYGDFDGGPFTGPDTTLIAVATAPSAA